MSVSVFGTSLGGELGPRVAKGEQGEKGDRGYRGERGNRGGKGEKGEKGEKGYQGFKGDRGEIGQKGDKGDEGDTGVRRRFTLHDFTFDSTSIQTFGTTRITVYGTCKMVGSTTGAGIVRLPYGHGVPLMTIFCRGSQKPITLVNR